MNKVIDKSASAGAVMARHLQLIGSDVPAWIGMLAPDAVLEFPYGASLGLPVRIDGAEAIADYMKSVGNSLGSFEFSNIDIMESVGGGEAWASFHGESTAETGRLYSQDYAAFMKVCDGRITFYREFWDPCRVAYALGTPLSIDETTGSQA